MKTAYFSTEECPLDHPAMPRALATVGATRALSVRHADISPAGSCYWNVDAYVKEHGGELILGWLVHLLPGVFIEMMHHGVLAIGGGKMIDITSYQDSKPSKTSTFIPSNKHKIDLAKPALIESQFVPLTNDPLVTAYIDAYRVNNRAQAAFHRQILFEPGYSWSPQEGLQGPQHSDALLKRIGPILSRRQQSFEAMQMFGHQILAKYFPQGR